MTNKNAQALGRLGGLATKKNHNKEHYQKQADHMNRVIKEKKRLKAKDKPT